MKGIRLITGNLIVAASVGVLSQVVGVSLKRKGAKDYASAAGLLATCAIFSFKTRRHFGIDFTADIGREVQTPLRISQGAMLYRDLTSWVYGPLAPYLHAAVFRVFGARMNVLYQWENLVLFLACLSNYGLARTMVGPFSALASAYATFASIGLFSARKSLPYSASNLYAVLFNNLSLLAAQGYLRKGSLPLLALAGVSTAASLLAKPTMGVAAAASIPQVLVRLPSGSMPLISKSSLTSLTVFGSVSLGLAGTVYAYFAAKATPSKLMAALLPGREARSIWTNPPFPPIRALIPADATIGSIKASAGALTFWLLPFSIAASGMSLLRRFSTGNFKEKDRSLLLVTSSSALSSLQLFPTADLAHLIWSLPGPLVLLANFGRSIAAAFPNIPYVKKKDHGFLQVTRLSILSALFSFAIFSLADLAKRKRQVRFRNHRADLYLSEHIGRSMVEVVSYLKERTEPDEPIVAVPDGGLFHFLSERVNPLSDDEVILGFLDRPGETKAAIMKMEQRGVKYVVLTGAHHLRYEKEPRTIVFGQDYAREFHSYLMGTFEVEAHFGRNENGYRVQVLRRKNSAG